MTASERRPFYVPARPYLCDENVVGDAERESRYRARHGVRGAGTFLLDSFPRRHKFKHTAQFAIRKGVQGVQTAVGALVYFFNNISACRQRPLRACLLRRVWMWPVLENHGPYLYRPSLYRP